MEILKGRGHDGVKDLSFGRLVAHLDTRKMPDLFRRFPELDYNNPENSGPELKRAWDRFSKGSAIEFYRTRRV